jgi:hypothetical protein
MSEVLEIKNTKINKDNVVEDAFSWKVEIPAAVKTENDLSENAYLVLTVHQGKINGELINPTAEIKKEVNRIIEKYRDTFEEMKRLGD